MFQDSELGRQMIGGNTLYLRVQSLEFERVFELASGDERVVAVGSAVSADIRLDLSGVSPIHFYFERSDSEVWIVPAYCISELRVNAAKIVSPYRLGRRTIVEFGTVKLLAEVHSQRYGIIASSSEDSHVDRDTDSLSYLSHLPEEDAPTRQAWNGAESGLVSESQPGALALGGGAPDGFSSDPPGIVPAIEPSASLAKTVRIPRAVTNEHIVSARRMKSSGSNAMMTTHSPVREVVKLSPLNKTLLGLSPSTSDILNRPVCKHRAGGLDRPQRKESSVQWQVATLSDSPPIHGLGSRNIGYLTRLGQLTKRYPVRVCAAAIAIALVSSSIVTLAAKLAVSKTSTRVSPPQSVAGTQPENAGQSDGASNTVLSVSTQMQSPPIAVAGRNPDVASGTREGAPSVKAIPTSDIAFAIQCLERGQYAEAQAAYNALSIRPGAALTESALSNLLTRRLSPKCISLTSERPLSCPEVIQ